MPAFPVDIRISGRPVLVVGGDRLALRRIEALLHCGASVTVVSSVVEPAIAEYARAERVQWWSRQWSKGDAAGFRVVICAAETKTLGEEVCRDAHEHGALVTVTDVPELCDFYFGAIAREGHVALSVFTDGRAPGMAGRLRDEMVKLLGSHTAERTDRFSELRDTLRALHPEAVAERAKFLLDYAAPNLVDTLRAPGGMELALARYEDGWRRLQSCDDAKSPAGKVYLVGAGPGDPELLTVKAARCIERADDLVVDALVSSAVYAGATGRVLYVGKRAGQRRLGQAETSRLLVELAQQGRTVVRLKGGDPNVFGRISEEISVLREANVSFDVIPGITSAVAAPSAAGISVTERDVADRFVVMTGHGQADDVDERQLPVFDVRQTVVVLMGVGQVERIVSSGRRMGYPSELPVAIISQATLPSQQVVRCTLGELASVVAAHGELTPATIVLGSVAAQREVPSRASSLVRMMS